MIPFYTPDKSVAPISLRAIEQWQLTHEGARFVTSNQLLTGGVQGREVYNTDDGLYYIYDGSVWKPRPQLLTVGGGVPAALNRETNSPQSADAGHDVGVSLALIVPTIVTTENRICLEVVCPAFVYAVDPGADAVFSILITDSANNVLVSADSHFFTGRLTASGVTAKKFFIDNSILTAGSFTIKARVSSTNITQSYGTVGAANKPLTLAAWVY